MASAHMRLQARAMAHTRDGKGRARGPSPACPTRGSPLRWRRQCWWLADSTPGWVARWVARWVAGWRARWAAGWRAHWQVVWAARRGSARGRCRWSCATISSV
eukprot:3004684-Pleurochrysis_carterae.AAC.1